MLIRANSCGAAMLTRVLQILHRDVDKRKANCPVCKSDLATQEQIAPLKTASPRWRILIVSE